MSGYITSTPLAKCTVPNCCKGDCDTQLQSLRSLQTLFAMSVSCKSGPNRSLQLQCLCDAGNRWILLTWKYVFNSVKTVKALSGSYFSYFVFIPSHLRTAFGHNLGPWLHGWRSLIWFAQMLTSNEPIWILEITSQEILQEGNSMTKNAHSNLLRGPLFKTFQRMLLAKCFQTASCRFPPGCSSQPRIWPQKRHPKPLQEV